MFVLTEKYWLWMGGPYGPLSFLWLTSLTCLMHSRGKSCYGCPARVTMLMLVAGSWHVCRCWEWALASVQTQAGCSPVCCLQAPPQCPEVPGPLTCAMCLSMIG